MHRTHAPVSLADLSAAGVRLRPYEAVTIVRELLLRVAREEVAGVPSAHVIRLSSTGAVSVEGPVEAGGHSVMRAAQLLDSLLPGSEAGNQFRVPGGLKLVVARALGTLDLPPFASLDAFAEALERFGSTDPTAAVSNLVVSWGELVETRAPEPADPAPPPAAQVQPFVSSRTHDIRAHLSRDPLTVSDIRRARRATGLPLSAIAQRSRIPVGLLRQLEWGYLINWPAGQYGRSQLIRYARAAGLDEDLVVATVVPLLEQVDRPSREVAAAETNALAARGEPALVVEPAIDLTPVTPIRILAGAVEPAHERRRWLAAAAALAIPALLTIGLLPAWWARQSSTPESAPTPTAVTAPATVESTAPAAARREQPSPAPTDVAEGSSPAPARSQRATPASHAEASRSEAAGGGEYRLASDRAFSPGFASAGTAMFYHDEASGPSALMRADAAGDGSVLRVTRIVDDTASNFNVRPSPDGTRIAFDSDRDGVRGVYVADADGKHVKRMSGDGFAAVPTWSPDGGRLAFVRADGDSPGRADADIPAVLNLWTLDLSSGDMQQITRHKYGQPWGGSWFPDGRRIAYSHETRLIIHDLQTGAERTFETPRRGHLVRTPTVSPDGRRVVFQVHRDGTWMLELANNSMRRLLDDPTAEEYTWSPDGRRVAYYSRRAGGWGVWVMAPR